MARPQPQWHDEDGEFRPVPQEAGALGPPGRRPPTAVGTATPRGPLRPDRPSGSRRYRIEPPRTRRVAIALVSGLLGVSGSAVLVASAPTLVTALGLALVAGGAAGAWRLVKPRA